jgi:chromosome segregation ATPase
MGAELDPSEFVDSDFQAARKAAAVAAAQAGDPQRAPTREEIEAKVGEMQHKLAELKRAQQDIERERSALEETRRRQVEFTTGRQEMVDQLTRGIGLLEEGEFGARREAEQMSKALVGLREALAKVQAVREDTWTRENLSQELTRANVAVENARMEWNNARLKFTVINGASQGPGEPPKTAPAGEVSALLHGNNYLELFKLGFFLTWPLALVGVIVLLLLLMK